MQSQTGRRSIGLLVLLTSVGLGAASPELECGRRWWARGPSGAGSRLALSSDGQRNLPGQFPFLVRINANYAHSLPNGTKQNREVMWSGVALGKSHVITTHSAFPPPQYCDKLSPKLVNVRVHVGAVNSSKGLTYSVKRYIKHPKFSCDLYELDNVLYRNVSNDIAIMEIQGQFKFKVNLRGGVDRVCVALGSDSYGHSDTEAYFTGFGRFNWSRSSKVSRHFKTHFVEADKCRERLATDLKMPGVIVANESLCLGTNNQLASEDSNVCFSDHGGALVIDTSDNWQLVGLMSHHIAGELCLTKLISFTRVANFVDWLKKYIPDVHHLMPTPTPAPLSRLGTI